MGRWSRPVRRTADSPLADARGSGRLHVKKLYGIVAVILSAVLLLGQQAAAADEAKAKANAAAKAKQIALTLEQNARVLTVFGRDGKTVAEIGEKGLYTQPVFSPDKTKVAVIKNDLEAQAADLWVIDVASSKATRITTSKERESVSAPVWSPDGKQVAYVAQRE